MYNELGNYAPSMVTKWTKAAVECYRQKNCEDCPVYLESQPCQMKAAVLELVRTLGKPDINKDYKDGSFKGYGIKHKRSLSSNEARD